MTREETKEIIQEDYSWCPIEAFKLKNEGMSRIMLWVSIFNAKTKSFVLKFCVGGHSMDLYVKAIEEGFDFGISCKESGAWFSSKNLNECFELAEKWFENNA